MAFVSAQIFYRERHGVCRAPNIVKSRANQRCLGLFLFVHPIQTEDADCAFYARSSFVRQFDVFADVIPFTVRQRQRGSISHRAHRRSPTTLVFFGLVNATIQLLQASSAARRSSRY